MRQLTRDQATEITTSELTRLIFQLIKEGQSNPKAIIDHLLPSFARNRNLDVELEKFENKFQEAWATLLRRGLIMKSVKVRDWGEAGQFQLTSIGRKSDFADGIFILVDDAQEIIHKLKEKIPPLDSVIEQYFLEGLRACQEGLYISSVICLGAASERAIQCLAEAVIKYDSSYQSNIEKKTKISELTRYLSENINGIFKSIADGELRSTLRDKLEGIARIYRLNRNEAGHPDNLPQDWGREEQENYLNQFRRYITTIYEAIEVLLKHSPTTP